MRAELTPTGWRFARQARPTTTPCVSGASAESPPASAHDCGLLMSLPIRHGTSAPLGATVYTRGRQLQCLFQERFIDRAAVIRRRTRDAAIADDRPRPRHQPLLSLLARIRPGTQAGSGLRVPRTRTVRSETRLPIRRREAAPRSVRARRRRTRHLRPQCGKPTRQQRLGRDEKRRGRPGDVRLGG